MEFLLILLLLLAAAVVVVGAKHGAEVAQREREARWSGLSVGRPDVAAAAGAPATVSAQQAPAGGGGTGAGQETGDGQATGARRQGRTPVAEPPAAGPNRRRLDPETGAAGSAPGAGRPALRAFRRSEGSRSPTEPAARTEKPVGVAGGPRGRQEPASTPARAEATRRAAGSAAQGATATARAVRATASAALRREPAPIDINRASADDLQNLPGVGIRAAQRIVAYRERNGDFPSVDALTKVEGFDHHRVSRLAPRATV